MTYIQEARRSIFEQKMAIFEAIAERKVIYSHIMFRARLAATSLNKLLDDLIYRGMITTVNEGNFKEYHLTEKGWIILRLWRQLNDTFEDSSLRE